MSMMSPTNSDWEDPGSSTKPWVAPRSSSPLRHSTIGPPRLPPISESIASMGTLEPGLALTADEAVPPIPHKSHFRRFSEASANSLTGFSRSGRPPRASADTLPPKYVKYNYDAGAPEVGGAEKAERLQENEKIAKRGGWGRLVILIAVVICVAIALGVGLGIGLSKHKRSSSAASPAIQNPTTAAALGFPVGEYSLNTALRTVQTNCTSNPSTWRCYPYSTYSSGSSTASASLTSVNWILSNTSRMYITNETLPTTDTAGIPANLSISSSNNPFSITFSDKALMYYNNDSHPRYEFSYTLSQQVIPTTALTSDNSATTCFYNNTMFTGVLYLSDAMRVSFPTANITGSYEGWPYAVRIEQVAAGGANVPACYKTVNGVVGERITDGFTQEPVEDQCICDYRNYEL